MKRTACIYVMLPHNGSNMAANAWNVNLNNGNVNNNNRNNNNYVLSVSAFRALCIK